MKLAARWLTAIIQFFDTITLQPPARESLATPALKDQLLTRPHVYYPEESSNTEEKGPHFHPPSHGSSDFQCYYPEMVGWKNCSTADDRGCWLKHDDGSVIDIKTNYENVDKIPIGVTRQYELIINDEPLDPDGFIMPHGKIFNNSYPGPWIQGCWGDTFEITVKNNLTYNGTTIHWHGIRQLNTMEMDGVNAITQCAIAPGDSYTYKFRAMQYGTSWYHSHYSLQYGDGALGPMTIYGPSSAPYDHAIDPILMTDWSHRSAFQDFYVDLGAAPFPGGDKTDPPPEMTSILLNGKGYENHCNGVSNLEGNCGPKDGVTPIFVEKGKRYLLRLINTSVDSTFIFSIDNHNLTMLTSDFVPIEPYSNTSVMVGIGQRYHVVVEANPTEGPGHSKLPEDQENFWIRMRVADGCGSFNVDRKDMDTRRGVLRYNWENLAIPSSNSNKYSTKCSDETYGSLKPIIPWNVGWPANPQRGFLEAGLTLPPLNGSKLPHGGFARWALGDNPMWLDFNNPTILSMTKAANEFPPEQEVIAAEYDPDAWVYMVITAAPLPFKERFRKWIPTAHPIHLHGHDFAILEQSEHPYWENMVNMKFDNPPRRDTALLPSNGYLIIAFKADNPGIWIMHCHIAMHASSGLAVQIIERQGYLRQVYMKEKAKELATIKEGCNKFNSWYSSKRNWWNWDEFQDDSGI